MIKKIICLSLVIVILFPISEAMAITTQQQNSIYGDSEYYDPNQCGGSPSATQSPSAATTGLGSGSSVYILGDSITDRAASTYVTSFKQQGITANLDFADGRGIVSPGNGDTANTNNLTGMQAVSNDASEVTSAGAIIVALGTNDTQGDDTTANIDQLINTIRTENPKAPIYWVDVYAINSSILTSAQVGQINSVIYGEATKDNYQVISWYKTVDADGNPLAPSNPEQDPYSYIDTTDGYGVHPDPTGVTALVSLVLGEVTNGSPSSSSQSAGQGSCCGVNITGTVAAVPSQASWTANVQSPYYLEEYAINLLEDLAQATNSPKSSAVTYEHVVALVAWFWAEGGDIENSDLFNPLNTSENVPGATVQTTGNDAYPNFDSGIEATTLTMIGSFQSRIASALVNPSTTAEQVMQAVAYYQNYPGNKAWAAADTADQQGYLNGLLANVEQARSNYDKEAATEIGTSGYEEAEGLRVPNSALQYGSVASAPSTPGSLSDATCGSSGSPSGTGNYQNPLRSVQNLVPERIDEGVDFSGTGPVYAMGDGTIVNVSGSGWPNGVFISYTLSDGPAQGKTVYFAECVTPSVSVGQTVTPSTVIGTMINCGSGVETGWAEPNGDLAMAHDVYVEGDVTAFGVNYSQLLQSLNAPPGVMDRPTVTGALPAGWPSW